VTSEKRILATYQEKGRFDIRDFVVDEVYLTFRNRNFRGVLTDEVLIPLGELRPGISRTWPRDGQLHTILLWSVLALWVLLMAGTLLLPERVPWVPATMVGLAGLVGAMAFIALDTRRYETCGVYYKTGAPAASITKRGDTSSEFAAFVAALEAKLAA
jgi:hypothetical protein